MEWTTNKPDFPCVFLCRSHSQNEWWYSLYLIKEEKCIDEDNVYYLAWCDYESGEELDDLEELSAEEYLIIELLKEK